MVTTDKQHYFNVYWKRQDKHRVSRRSEWRAEQLYSLIGHNYRSLVDIGAGQGELITFFRAAGYRVEGWDISTESVEALKDAGYAAKVVDLEADEFDGLFDVAACCDVLQHIDDPAAVLRKASGVIKPNGRLFFSVPNEFHILRRLGFGKPDEAHVQLFSPRRARELATISGYVIVKKLYQPLVPPRWGKRWTQFGIWLSRLSPSLFCLSAMILAKRPNEN